MQFRFLIVHFLQTLNYPSLVVNLICTSVEVILEMCIKGERSDI